MSVWIEEPDHPDVQLPRVLVMGAVGYNGAIISLGERPQNGIVGPNIVMEPVPGKSSMQLGSPVRLYRAELMRALEILDEREAARDVE